MIMLHIFTEEPSLKIVFESVLPKLIPENVYYQIYCSKKHGYIFRNYGQIQNYPPYIKRKKEIEEKHKIGK